MEMIAKFIGSKPKRKGKRPFAVGRLYKGKWTWYKRPSGRDHKFTALIEEWLVGGGKEAFEKKWGFNLAFTKDPKHDYGDQRKLIRARPEYPAWMKNISWTESSWDPDYNPEKYHRNGTRFEFFKVRGQEPKGSRARKSQAAYKDRGQKTRIL